MTKEICKICKETKIFHDGIDQEKDVICSTKCFDKTGTIDIKG